MASSIRSEFESEFESEPFELIAQSGQRRFFVHGDILSSQSEPLWTMIAGKWKESSERKIDLSEWDGGTVARLIDFLYTGDYRSPDPTPIPLEKRPILLRKPSRNVTARNEDGDDQPMPDFGRPLTPLGLCLPHTSGQSEKAYITRLELFDPNEYSFKDVFLAHARTYVLAQYKDVAALRKLALNRVFHTLLLLNPIHSDSPGVEDIVCLFSYVYSHTDALENFEEPLRKIVSQFAALNFLALQPRAKMIELVSQGGDFVKDLMAKVGRRLRSAEKDFEESSRIRFVSNISVEYTRLFSPRPLDYVRELGGLSSDINYGFGSGFAWFIPEYTFDPQDACTSFQIVTQKRQDAIEFNLSWGESVDDMFCYLIPIKDPRVKKKITEVFLLRNPNMVNIVEKYDGITADINTSRRKDVLCLTWKSIAIGYYPGEI